MATKKTTRAAKPRAAKPKAAVKPTVRVSGPSKLLLNMPLDARKIEAIKRCVDKGTLKITLSKVDLSTGKLGDGWLYD